MQVAGAKIVSFIPGRVRLKVDALQGAPDFAARVEERLGALDAIKAVEIKTDTGSVLVKYDRKAIGDPANAEALCNCLEELFPDFDTEKVRKWLT